MLSRIQKTVAAAEKEYKAARAVAEPFEIALAEAKAKLEASMGSNRLGSLLELEDLDAIAGKEKELVRWPFGVA